MDQRPTDPAATRAEVGLPLTIDDLTGCELDECGWAGGPTHLAAVADALRRVADGEVEYLAIRGPAGSPIAIGGIDFMPFADAGYLWQLAVHPVLRRCGIGTVLVRALEDRVHRRGLLRTELRYEEHETRLRDFYEGLGYTAYGTAPDGWHQSRPDGEVEWHETICVQMRRFLVPAPDPGD